MSTEIKFGDAATMVEEVAIGAAQTAAEVASAPIGSARKSVRGFEKKGADMVGGVAKRTLRIFNGSFKTIARTATRLEQATELTTAKPVAVKTGRTARRSARRRAA